MKWTPNREPAASLSATANPLIFLFRFAVLLALTLISSTACADNTAENPTTATAATPSPGAGVIADIEPTQAPPATTTPPPPSPTPQLAAMVNGQPILLEEFERELVRYELAQTELGLDPGADGQDHRQLVLEALIERELINQAASISGITISPDMVESKLAELRRTASESGSFDDWLAANQWTLEEFSEALAAEMLVGAMITEITSDVPYTAEQVRASYIQLDDETLANDLHAQIKDGADFAALATRYSRDSLTGPAGGDLGFFARGSLLVPEVEDVAYELEPGEVSDVLSVANPEGVKVTYYIIKVTERDPDRPLNANLRHQLLQESFDSWLTDQWSKATIVRLLE